MTNTRHTPGPWRVEATAYRNQPHVVNEHGAFVADTDAHNARLIAAAPELLAALQDCVAVPNKNRPDEVWQRARAAIAKATGQTD
jgi:hypothetical protein